MLQTCRGCRLAVAVVKGSTLPAPLCLRATGSQINRRKCAAGRWEARVGLPGTHKHIYLGLFCEEAQAARAYDRSMVRLHGSGAATNFPLSDYTGDMADHHLMQKVTAWLDGRALLNAVVKAGLAC